MAEKTDSLCKKCSDRGGYCFISAEGGEGGIIVDPSILEGERRVILPLAMSGTKLKPSEITCLGSITSGGKIIKEIVESKKEDKVKSFTTAILVRKKPKHITVSHQHITF